jgi:RNA polymerase sigma factor (sigma-70 family)
MHMGSDMLPDMSDTDMELLARYTRQHAEDAFAELVRRHLGLVYSAALRQIRSPQLAEEVAQSAFIDLACTAARLKPDTILTAWLYQVTRRTAIDVVRREASRQLREQIATEMNAMNATAADWTHIEPLLDEAMHALDDTDRTAVLLRYFENKSLREVGATLGTSENAAQKRLGRAVERLREFFARRGVSVGASGLIVVISAKAVQAAPAGLAVMISTAAAVTGTTIATTAPATATKAIALTTLQKTLITATVVVSMVTLLVVRHQAQARLRAQDEALRQRSDQLAQLAADNERLSNLAAQANGSVENAQLNELRKLRSEAELLRGQTKQLAMLQEENRRLQQPPLREAKTAMQLRELIWAKQQCAEAWMSAFIAYARENQGQLPASFEQAEPFWLRSREIGPGTGLAADRFENLYSMMADQFEILYHGSLDSLTNLDVIVFREKKLWPHETGKWGRFYALANGEIQYCSSSDKTASGNFDKYEREHMAPTTGR